MFLSHFPKDPSEYLPNNGDVLKLSSVTRRDSGIYQCRPLEAGSQSDVKGEMLLTVHCENHSNTTALASRATMLICLLLASCLPLLSNRCFPQCFLLSDGFVWLCADLDPAVVVPKESEFMLKGEDLTATCNALSSLKTSTVWYKVSLCCELLQAT